LGKLNKVFPTLTAGIRLGPRLPILHTSSVLVVLLSPYAFNLFLPSCGARTLHAHFTAGQKGRPLFCFFFVNCPSSWSILQCKISVWPRTQCPFQCSSVTTRLPLLKDQKSEGQLRRGIPNPFFPPLPFFFQFFFFFCFFLRVPPGPLKRQFFLMYVALLLFVCRNLQKVPSRRKSFFYSSTSLLNCSLSPRCVTLCRQDPFCLMPASLSFSCLIDRRA